jgi:hypothetical protein
MAGTGKGGGVSSSGASNVCIAAEQVNDSIGGGHNLNSVILSYSKGEKTDWGCVWRME